MSHGWSAETFQGNRILTSSYERHASPGGSEVLPPEHNKKYSCKYLFNAHALVSVTFGKLNI